MCSFPTPIDKSAMAGAAVAPASNVDINLRKVEELRHSLEEEINNFYSDLDCYRFLSKHNYNITKTKDMLIKHYHWYTTPVRTWKIRNPALSPRDMGKVPIDSKQSEYDRVFPCSFLGEDLEGHPIFWEKAGYIAANWANVKQHFNPDELLARHIRRQELMRGRCRLSSERYGRIIDKQVIIKDMKGVPMFADWGSSAAFKETVRVDESYYPQTLKTMFVINASVYVTAMWSVTKLWLDPLTVEKIQILGDDYYPTLIKHISEDMIPVEYGGKRINFSWAHPANFDE